LDFQFIDAFNDKMKVRNNAVVNLTTNDLIIISNKNIQELGST